MSLHKRTFKKRIIGVINYCVVFTIVVFSVFILALSGFFIKISTTFLCRYYAESISQTMNSAYFLNQMNVDDIRRLNPDSLHLKQWLKNIHRLTNQGFDGYDKTELERGEGLDELSEDSGFLNISNLINIEISVENRIIYSKSSKPSYFDNQGGNNILKSFVEKVFSNQFKAETKREIYDSEKKQIGLVTASVNIDFIIYFFFSVLCIIIIFSLCVLVFIKIVIRIITEPIVIPLNRLNDTILSISQGDFDNIINSRINVKRPLEEIENLADSTNKIIDKMKDYNEAMAAQNEELEAQNEELTYSKRQIQEQQTALVQIENMASIGQLTAAITHEINTPLGAISSNSQMFEMFIRMLSDNPIVASNEELKQLVESMNEINNVSIMACNRVTEIIRSLKTFTHIDQAEFQETNIIESLKSVLVLSSNLWKKKITIHEEYGELETVKCYSGLLNQVFMNVFVNAIQSIEDRGDIYIKTYNDEDYMYISIRDTGMGISKDNLKSIFEMGYTTKGSGIGMGLGLAISNNIVKKHNGEIIVNSELGVGTEFIISIPLK